MRPAVHVNGPVGVRAADVEDVDALNFGKFDESRRRRASGTAASRRTVCTACAAPADSWRGRPTAPAPTAARESPRVQRASSRRRRHRAARLPFLPASRHQGGLGRPPNGAPVWAAAPPRARARHRLDARLRPHVRQVRRPERWRRHAPSLRLRGLALGGVFVCPRGGCCARSAAAGNDNNTAAARRMRRCGRIWLSPQTDRRTSSVRQGATPLVYEVANRSTVC